MSWIERLMRPKVSVKLHLNIYADGTSINFDTKERADGYLSLTPRIAYKHIEFTIQQGDNIE